MCPSFWTRVKRWVFLLVSFSPDQSEKRTGLYICFMWCYMWVLLKELPCLSEVFIAGCVSILCMCVSLAHMFIFATGWPCEWENSSCICLPSTKGPPQVHQLPEWAPVARKEAYQAAESTRRCAFYRFTNKEDISETEILMDFLILWHTEDCHSFTTYRK